MAKPPHTGGELRAFYPVFKRGELAARWRYTTSWKQYQCNERLLDLFMEKFALDPTWVKNHACYDELRTYGAIAA
jgi:hypothetical protein